MAKRHGEQVSLKLPENVLSAVDILIEPMRKASVTPLFPEGVNVTRSAVLRAAIERGVKVLQRELGRRASDQPTTPPPIQLLDPTSETTRPARPSRPAPTTGDTMTGAELDALLDRLKAEHGVLARDFAEAAGTPQSHLSKNRKKGAGQLTEKMAARIRATVAKVAPGFDWNA